jgi:hypothetical protein
MPPDVTAGIFWLKNRDPENWPDMQNVDHVLGKYIISDRPMTEEDLTYRRVLRSWAAGVGGRAGVDPFSATGPHEGL